jgi:putative flippase GtrA
LLRFVVVGGTNTLATGVAFYLVALVLAAKIAFSLVYVAGLTFTVLVTPRYVFGVRSSRARRLLLALWYFGTYLVGIGVISLLKDVVDTRRIVVVVGTVMVTAPLSFLGGRLLVAGR